MEEDIIYLSLCVFDIMFFSFMKTYLVFLSITHVGSNCCKVGFVYSLGHTLRNCFRNI